MDLIITKTVRGLRALGQHELATNYTREAVNLYGGDVVPLLDLLQALTPQEIRWLAELN